MLSLFNWTCSWIRRAAYLNMLDGDNIFFFVCFLSRQLIQNGLLFECSSNPREVHRLLPPLWAPVRPLVIHHPAGRPHAAFCQCWHEPGNYPHISTWFPNICASFRMALEYIPTDLHLLTVTLPLSSSPSSSTPSIRPTPWPGCNVPPTPRSVSVQEANTTTWTTWVKMFTITPSLRCWAPGPSVTTLRYYCTLSYFSICVTITVCEADTDIW